MQFPKRILSGVAALAVGVGLAWTAASPSVSATDETSTQQGVYTAEQAERGETLFTEACLVCHQPEEFTDGGYMEGWSGQKASDMLDLIRSTMPEDNPGRLKRQEYADIMSYLFNINGLPEGEVEMESKLMKDIRIEGPFETQN